MHSGAVLANKTGRAVFITGNTHLITAIHGAEEKDSRVFGFGMDSLYSLHFNQRFIFKVILSIIF